MGNQRGLGLHLIFLFVFLVAACLGGGNTSVVCSEKERLALLNFKHSVKDDSKILSSWVGNDCCQWEGIHCDSLTGNVESLHLGGDNGRLVGDEVSLSLAELKHLKYLDFSGNDFGYSRIPEFIGSLKQLSYLNLSHADFGGNIPPHIGNLSNLKVLDLSSNFELMTDDVVWTFGLSSLTNLDLMYVDLSRTQNLAMVLYMIPSLKELSLSGCMLSNANLGSFHNSCTILSNIKHLDLSFNSFQGPLPGFLQNMTSLVFLDLSGFDISLTWNFANLLNMIPSLSELHLSECELDDTFLSPLHLNFTTLSNIRHLDLSQNSIAGIFPSFLKNMSSLRVLHLSSNQLNGSIPEFLGNLSALTDLDLGSNGLTGPIPTFLENFSRLDLSRNQLNGSVPESIGNLASLTELYLGYNRLTGPIPTSLGKLVSLQTVSVPSNLLNGTIPVSLGQLSKLYLLDVSNNSLEGVVSEAHFANLSMLRSLDASHNTKLTYNVSRGWIPPFQLEFLILSFSNISNEFPQWLQNQRKLKRLELWNTTISGPLPTWLRKMPIIPYVDLSHNKLSEPLTNLPNGEKFYSSEYPAALFLENNLFNESIPRSLCRRTEIRLVDISRNRLTGKIPKCLDNLQMLVMVRFSSNQLSGDISSYIPLNASSLFWLGLNDNAFIGELPLNLENFQALKVLDLGDNKFSGTIPEWVGEKLRDLMILRLHQNNFSGRIPKSLCKNSKLQVLDVAYNNLTGSIPRCLEDLHGMVNGSYYPFGFMDSDENVIQVVKGAELEYTKTWKLVVNMDLSSNKLVGEIPVELTALSGLMGLNLSNNHLTGVIPDNIGNMTNLESLDFSKNELKGTIPSSMATLNFLSHLNLSHNNLSGRIPTGNQLQTLEDPSIYAGNKDLCGPPLSKNCSSHEDPSTRTSKKKDNEKATTIEAWLFNLDVMSGFATGFWGIIGVLLFKKQWRQKLFMFAEETMDKIYVAVMVRVAKMKRGREAA